MLEKNVCKCVYDEKITKVCIKVYKYKIILFYMCLYIDITKIAVFNILSGWVWYDTKSKKT